MPERLLLTLIGSVLVGLGLEIPISRGALDPPAPVRHLTHCGSFNGGRAHPFRGHAALACSGMQWHAVAAMAAMAAMAAITFSDFVHTARTAAGEVNGRRTVSP
jgi:hypothetical protein